MKPKKIKEIHEKLGVNFPGKRIFPPLEAGEGLHTIVCLVRPPNGDPSSEVLAFIERSKPHYHLGTTQVYQVLRGILHLYLCNLESPDRVDVEVLRNGRAFTINPGVIHWGVCSSHIAKVKIVSTPGLVTEDRFLSGMNFLR